MPTYEYRCLECGNDFEIFQRMNDDPLDACPECTGKVKRLIGSGAGVIFKGGGFYQTDYRSERYQKDAQKESKDPKQGPATSDKVEPKTNPT